MLWWHTPSEASVARRDWIFTQLASPSISVSNTHRGFQAGVSTLTYDSYSSTQGSLFWDSRFLEIGLKTASRFFGSLGVGRTPTSNALKDWNETYSVEIARRFLSPTGRFGRLGLQYDHFSPTSERFAHIALDTGILESEEESELMKLSFHLFKPLQRRSDVRLATSLDLGTVTSRWGLKFLRLGFNLGWTYHLSQEKNLDDLNSVSDKLLTSEHMLFSLGPWIEYAASNLLIKIMIPNRLFIDKQWEARTLSTNSSNETLVVSYPFDFSGPDLWASLTFVF